MNLFLLAFIITFAIPVFGFIVDYIVDKIYDFLGECIGYKLSRFLINWVTFIGVVHHELAHALFAFLTGAKITEVHLFKPEGKTLGSVTYISRGNIVFKSIQRTLTSIAPVICGCFSSYGLAYLLLNFSIPVWGRGLIFYTLISIITHMSMSKQDVKVMLKGVPIVYILVCLTIYLLSLV